MSYSSFSVVIPVFNEEESLLELAESIKKSAQNLGVDWEVVFVDDGSTDESWSIIQQICQSFPNAKGVRFRRNFGKAAALQAGVGETVHPVIFTMDADLQDDPSVFESFLQKIEQGADVVSGWKKIRHDPVSKTWPSKVFNRMVGWMSGVHLNDHNCGFKCYRREVFSEVRLYGELHRFIPVLASAKGFSVDEVAVPHHARKYGESKYGWRRLYRGFLDLMTVMFLTIYRYRPGHFLGFFGALFFGTGGFLLFWLVTVWCLNQVLQAGWVPLHQRPLVEYSLGAFLLGAQLLSMSFIAELITANSQEAGGNRVYSVKETAGIPDSQDQTGTVKKPAVTIYPIRDEKRFAEQ